MVYLTTWATMMLMELSRYKKPAATIAAALSFTSLAACGLSIDSYLTDPSDVQCDGRRTEADLAMNGMATFIVHGKQPKDIATIKVRRNEQGASVGVTGEITGPPQQLEADGFTTPTPVVDGSELSAFGAGGAWVIDVRKDTVVIQGTCDGM